jgi:hypothetical protein
MRVGRLEFGLIKGESDIWGHEKALCGCHIFCAGILYLTWTDKDCKCQKCLKYTCECEDKL